MALYHLCLFVAIFLPSHGSILSTPVEYENIVFVVPVESGKLNNRPIIAVLAQRYPFGSNQSYIAASYIKYLESAGARVVPIPHNYTKEKVDELFKYVNGVLFPGGRANLRTSDYYQHAKHIFQMAMKANDEGDFFPVWGTCLGFLALNEIVAVKSVVSMKRGSDVTNSLEFTKEAADTRLVKAMPKDLYKAISSEEITYNHHNYGVGPDDFNADKNLKNFYNIISLNKDETGEPYISTFEAKNYPFYGVQWHPEKNNFEMRMHFKNIPHTANAIRISQFVANFFVNEARKNHHKFPTQEMEDKHLIYEYNPVHTALVLKKGSMSRFEQCYIFKE